MFEKGWGITFDAFVHFSGRKFQNGYSFTFFGGNPSWFCENNSDLLNIFKINTSFPNQASWTVFRPSSTVSMKVISVLQMKHFEMD